MQWLERLAGGLTSRERRVIVVVGGAVLLGAALRLLLVTWLGYPTAVALAFFAVIYLALLTAVWRWLRGTPDTEGRH